MGAGGDGGGVGLFGVLTGYLANAFLSPKKDGTRTRTRTPGGAVTGVGVHRREPGRDQAPDRLTEQRQGQAELLERVAALERLLAAPPRK